MANLLSNTKLGANAVISADTMSLDFIVSAPWDNTNNVSILTAYNSNNNLTWSSSGTRIVTLTSSPIYIPPTYSVTVPSSINEGSAGTINVATTLVPDSTTLYYTLTNSSDFSVSSGSFTINSNSGSFNVTPTADNTTEGSETFQVEIRIGSTSGTIVTTSNSITINDTSLTPAAAGEHQFTTTGNHTFTVPANVTQVSAVCVGGGGGSSYCQGNSSESGAGGGGGGLSTATFSVTPGENLTIYVGSGGQNGNSGYPNGGLGLSSSVKRGSTALVIAYGGGEGLYKSTGGSGGLGGSGYGFSTGGAQGGDGGAAQNNGGGGGGGGAAGYSGRGGGAGTGNSGTGTSVTGGGGGGGGGQSTAGGQNNGGGGVGIFGEGSSGSGGAVDSPGGGGSGGTSNSSGAGGTFGGGGGGKEDDTQGFGASGGDGAVRIVWGSGRSFPSTFVSLSDSNGNVTVT